MRKQKRKTKEERIQGVKAPEKGAPAASNAFEHKRLLHELQVHQVELETQNRELREAQQLLELSRDRYADLYDFAPVGYVTFDDKGVIREINLTAAGMLGVERTRLVGVPFHLRVAREDLARFRRHLAEFSDPEKRVVTELQLTRKGGGVLSVVMQSVLVYDAERKGYLCRTTLTDITARRQAEQALHDNEARLRAVLETAAEGIITIDERGTIESFNQAAEKLFDYSAVEAIGRNISLLMPSPYREQHDRYLANYRDTGERKIIGIGREVTGRRKNGSTFPLELAVSEVRLAGRHIFTGILRDITQRRQAEEALLASQAMLTRSQEIAHVGGWEINLTGTGGDRWSEETFRILGLDPATKELTPIEYVLRCVHPEDQARVREAFDKSRNERVRFDLECRIARPDGSIRHVHSIVEPVPGASNQVVKLAGTLQDITERKKLEKEILEISERERSRIGQDLHDGLCQHLAGIEFRLLGLKQKLEGQSSQQAAETAEVAKLVRQGMEQTRTLAWGLSPVFTAADGLMSALQELATSTEQAFQTACSFNCPTPVLLHDNAVATHLYRIAQEAIQNAIRHGKAKFIVISLFTQNDRIVLGVKDDGVGFPKQPRKHGGMGLRVMQYRAGMVGGSLVVQHEPEGGTAVVCSLRVEGAGPPTGRPEGRRAEV